MEQLSMLIEKVPVIAQTDVLVVGSGPAGIAAAVAAARGGASVILAERYGCLGGALSVSNVESYSFSVNQHMETLSGIPLEIDQRVRAGNACQPEHRGGGVLIDPEMYKCLLDAWMAECGVRVMLHSQACNVLQEENRVNGVVFYGKSGFRAVKAKVIVDATGDGDVAAMAGASFEQREKEKLMPVTTVIGLSGIDMKLFKEHIQLHSREDDPEYGLKGVLRRAWEAGDWPLKKAGAWKITTEYGDICSLNLLMIRNVDCTDVEDLTFAETEGRKQALQAVNALRKYGADIGFAACFLRSIAPQLGLRESRRIKGVERLTVHHMMDDNYSKTGIGRFVCFADNWGKFVTGKKNETFSLPYGILVPETVDGLLVAGRCVSCDEESYGAVRMMVCCAITGQAAGTAASICAASNVEPRNIDVSILQAQLRTDGVVLS